MKPNFLQQIDLWIKGKYALAMSIICLLLMFMSTQNSNLNLKPNLLLAAVYFWAVYKPEDLGVGKVFLLGMFFDLLENSLLGINALTLLLTFVITGKLRRFIMGKPFIISFWGIMVMSLGVFITKWFFISLSQSEFIHIKFVVVSYILTILFYPAIGLLGAKVYAASLKD